MHDNVRCRPAGELRTRAYGSATNHSDEGATLGSNTQPHLNSGGSALNQPRFCRRLRLEEPSWHFWPALSRAERARRPIELARRLVPPIPAANLDSVSAVSFGPRLGAPGTSSCEPSRTSARDAFT